MVLSCLYRVQLGNIPIHLQSANQIKKILDNNVKIAPTFVLLPQYISESAILHLNCIEDHKVLMEVKLLVGASISKIEPTIITPTTKMTTPITAIISAPNQTSTHFSPPSIYISPSTQSASVLPHTNISGKAHAVSTQLSKNHTLDPLSPEFNPKLNFYMTSQISQNDKKMHSHLLYQPPPNPFLSLSPTNPTMSLNRQNQQFTTENTSPTFISTPQFTSTFVSATPTCPVYGNPYEARTSSGHYPDDDELVVLIQNNSDVTFGDIATAIGRYFFFGKF